MRMDKLTNQLQGALADAQSLALGKDHTVIEPVHLLAALLNQQGGSARPLLQKAGADIAALTAAVEAAVHALPTVSGSSGEIHVSPDLGKVLNLSDKLAQQGGDAYISSELVLLALLEAKSSAGEPVTVDPPSILALAVRPRRLRCHASIESEPKKASNMPPFLPPTCSRTPLGRRR